MRRAPPRPQSSGRRCHFLDEPAQSWDESDYSNLLYRISVGRTKERDFLAGLCHPSSAWQRHPGTSGERQLQCSDLWPQLWPSADPTPTPALRTHFVVLSGFGTAMARGRSCLRPEIAARKDLRQSLPPARHSPCRAVTDRCHGSCHRLSRIWGVGTVKFHTNSISDCVFQPTGSPVADALPTTCVDRGAK